MSSDEFHWDPKAFPKGDFDEDYYSVLEVDASASFKEIKKSYYRIVFLFHPDRKESEAEKSICNKQMMVINAAYKVLKDENLRAMYDKKRQKGLIGKKAVGKSAPTQSSSSSSSSSRQEPTKDTAGVDDITSPFVGNSGTTSSRFKNFVESEGDKYKRENNPTDYDDDDYTYDSNFNKVYKSRPKQQETKKNEKKWETYYTAPTFDDNTSLLSLKAKLEILQNERDTKMDALVTDNRDWGEVTDPSAIEQRLFQVQEVKFLDQKILELKSEIDNCIDQLQRSGYSYSPYESRGRDIDHDDFFNDNDEFSDSRSDYKEPNTWRRAYDVRRSGGDDAVWRELDKLKRKKRNE